MAEEGPRGRELIVYILHRGSKLTHLTGISMELCATYKAQFGFPEPSKTSTISKTLSMLTLETRPGVSSVCS